MSLPLPLRIFPAFYCQQSGTLGTKSRKPGSFTGVSERGAAGVGGNQWRGYGVTPQHWMTHLLYKTNKREQPGENENRRDNTGILDAGMRITLRCSLMFVFLHTCVSTSDPGCVEHLWVVCKWGNIAPSWSHPVNEKQGGFKATSFSTVEGPGELQVLLSSGEKLGNSIHWVRWHSVLEINSSGKDWFDKKVWGY